MKTEPNKAMERSRILVTDRAGARSAPSIRLAHLGRYTKLELVLPIGLLLLWLGFDGTALGQQTAKEYLESGLAKQGQGQNDAAIADYDRAHELDPKLFHACRHGGELKRSKGDLDGAIADFTKGIAACQEAKSIHTAFFYGLRSSARHSKGDVDGALADMSEGLKLYPENHSFFHARGILFYLKRDWKSALADFRSAIQHAAKWGADEEVCHLYVWIMRKRLGESESANEELALYLESPPKSDPRRVAATAGYMLDRVPEKSLFPRGSNAMSHWWDDVMRCNAWYVVGMKHLLSGDEARAMECFKESLKPSDNMAEGQMLAKAELKALAK